MRAVCIAMVLWTAAVAQAQLTVGGSFSTGQALVGLGHDSASNTVWSYGSFGSELRHYGSTGTFLGAHPRPGASANDADVEAADAALSLGGTPVPAGAVLYIDGESGAAEIYAVNQTTGAVIASLNTSFGVSHVVGGGYHPGRGTFFLVQDRVPGNPDANLIAEINVSTGAAVNVFRITDVRPTFTVNFGDMDIAGNGNLLVVSSDESNIGEFTPEGAFVQEHALPTGVSSLCGIAFDVERCEVWVGSTSGTVWRLLIPAGNSLCGPVCGSADFDCDGDVGTDADIEGFFACLGGTCPAPPCTNSADFDADGDVGTDADIEAFFRVLGGGDC
jgi:hypothetical protein